MKENCIDEGTIQAFLDGELSADMLEKVACHVSLCNDCSSLLQEAETESALAFDVFDSEFNTLVPTERIRTRVYQAISGFNEPKLSWWQKILSGISFGSPSFVAFASLLIIFGVFAGIFGLRNQAPVIDDKTVAAVDPTPEIGIEPITVSPTPSSSPEIVTPIQVNSRKRTISTKPQNAEFKVQNADFRIKDVPLRKTPKPDLRDSNPKPTMEILDGEATYLKTIATLENSVRGKKDSVLRVSSRISYERDMAVVNDSIRKMTAEVRKNPKNDAAKQILRNSYQNKIDLLNSVTERSEFMASLD